MGWTALLPLMVLAIVSWQWWLSVRQRSGLTNFLLLTLLNEANYQKQRENIRTLTMEVGAENAFELFAKISKMVPTLIAKVDQQRMSEEVVLALWEQRKMTPS